MNQVRLDREAFSEVVARDELLRPGEAVVVGYSTGPDSTALVHLLAKTGFKPIGAYLHHGLRAEADIEQEQARDLCQELDIPFYAGRATVGEMSHSLGIGLEEAGRHARYEFLHRIASGLSVKTIATGHTRTDQAETVLFHVLRGTGLRGLTGMKTRADNLIRPLLEFDREQTQLYCRENGLWTGDDPSNKDLSFSRSRLREVVFPELEAVHPGAIEGLIRLSKIAAEEDDFLDHMARHVISESYIPQDGPLSFISDGLEFRFDASILATRHPVLLRRSLKMVLRALDADLTYEQTEFASASILKHEGGSLTTEGAAVILKWDQKSLQIARDSAKVTFRDALPIPSTLDWEDWNWTLDVSSPTPLRTSIGIESRHSLTVTASAAHIKAPLSFRNWEPGDRMTPVGFASEKKVSDLLGEAKLTKTCRDRIPVICDMVGPLWIPGVCYERRLVSEKGPFFSMTFGPFRPAP